MQFIFIEFIELRFPLFIIKWSMLQLIAVANCVTSFAALSLRSSIMKIYSELELEPKGGAVEWFVIILLIYILGKSVFVQWFVSAAMSSNWVESSLSIPILTMILPQTGTGSVWWLHFMQFLAEVFTVLLTNPMGAHPDACQALASSCPVGFLNWPCSLQEWAMACQQHTNTSSTVPAAHQQHTGTYVAFTL